MARVLRHWLQEAIHADDPLALLHESLQPIEDSRDFPAFNWQRIEIALEDVLHKHRSLQTAASEIALEITGHTRF
ncbi:MAG TPA: hypothetical protein V6D19_06455 [Stenomitos sp.]